MTPRRVLRPKMLSGIAAVGAAMLLTAGLAPMVGASTRSPSSGVTLKALGQQVKALETLPPFKGINYYGGILKNAAKLKGDKVMVVPGDSELQACTEMGKAAAKLFTAAGMKPTIFSTKGAVTTLTTAANDAISQGYKAILYECDFSATEIVPEIAKAEKAGLKVVGWGSTLKADREAHLDGSLNTTLGLVARNGVEQAVYEHHGKPFQSIIIESKAVGTSPPATGALITELKKLCPQCKYTIITAEVTTWFSTLGSAVESALLRAPNATVIFDEFTGELTGVLAGIKGVHRTTTVKTYMGYGGGTAYLVDQSKGVGHTVIAGQIEEGVVWCGYEDVIQTARVLLGEPALPVAKFTGPRRLLTPQNVGTVLKYGGFGTIFVNQFRKMLGLKPLSRAAAIKAATLTGALTAKG
jgi:ABC-type sugar transport system substrate-binding protein